MVAVSSSRLAIALQKKFWAENPNPIGPKTFSYALAPKGLSGSLYSTPEKKLCLVAWVAIMVFLALDANPAFASFTLLDGRFPLTKEAHLTHI